MSTNKTTNYQLHSWAAEDKFLRSEMNENFSKLDSAARVVTGSYTGDGASSKVIALGFTPRVVLITSRSGQCTTNYDYYGGLALEGNPVYYSSGSGQGVNFEISEGGFTVHFLRLDSYFLRSNAKDEVFHFMAVR